MGSGNGTTRTGGIPHLPALDGLRGLALLGVLFFHSNKSLLGGYLGVDLFFVLSGFLITSLLLAEHHATGRIGLRAFWIRRARRLFPALLSLSPAIALYSRFFAQPDELARIRGDALATLGYVANWRAIFSHKSYWELFAAPSPLEHTWSLAIEEQFYVVWPVIVLLLLRGAKGKSANTRMLLLAVALTAISIVVMLVLFRPTQTSRAYLGTDTRASGILLGAALAAVLPPGTTTFERRTVCMIDALGIAAAIGLGVAWWKLDGQNPFLYRGGFWLTELAALVLIVCAVIGPKDSVVARVLAFRPLALVGTISYGLYLWHWPVNVFLTPARLSIVSAKLIPFCQFALTFAIAIVSYRFFEFPIRVRGLPFGRPIYIVPAAIALSVLLVVRATHARGGGSGGGGSLHPTASNDSAGGSEFAKASANDFKVLVLGDSTANSLGWTLRGVRRVGVVMDLWGKDGCTMLWDTCYGDKWAEQTKQWQPNASLVFLGGAFMHGITATDGSWQKSCHPEWDAKFVGVLTQRLGDLVSPKTRVFAVTLPYGLGVWESFRGEIDCINVSIRKAAAAVRGVEILDLAERICPKGVCEERSEGAAIRPDGVHYDMAGARVVSAWVLDQILAERTPSERERAGAP